MAYMIDIDEVITNTKCVECGDKLAEWEDTLCCICDAMRD